jgi:hypothetical protein
MSDRVRCCRLHAALNVRFRDHPISDLATDEGQIRQSCAASHLLRVRLTDCGLCLNDCASDADFRLR